MILSQQRYPRQPVHAPECPRVAGRCPPPAVTAHVDVAVCCTRFVARLLVQPAFNAAATAAFAVAKTRQPCPGMQENAARQPSRPPAYAASCQRTTKQRSYGAVASRRVVVVLFSLVPPARRRRFKRYSPLFARRHSQSAFATRGARRQQAKALCRRQETCTPPARRQKFARRRCAQRAERCQRYMPENALRLSLPPRALRSLSIRTQLIRNHAAVLPKKEQTCKSKRNKCREKCESATKCENVEEEKGVKWQK